MPRVQKIKAMPISFWPFCNWLLITYCKGNNRFWHSLLWTLWNNGLERSVLAVCNICFLKTINYIKVQRYLFGNNGLRTVLAELSALLRGVTWLEGGFAERREITTANCLPMLWRAAAVCAAWQKSCRQLADRQQILAVMQIYTMLWGSLIYSFPRCVISLRPAVAVAGFRIPLLSLSPHKKWDSFAPAEATTGLMYTVLQVRSF